MAIIVRDEFDEASDVLLQSHSANTGSGSWSKLSGSDITVKGGLGYATPAANATCEYGRSEVSADQIVRFGFRWSQNGDRVTVRLRRQSGGGAYIIRLEELRSAIYRDSGSTQLGADGTGMDVAGRSAPVDVEVSIIGSTITAKVSGATLISRTDATYASGTVTIEPFVQNTGGQITYFEIDDNGSGGGSAPSFTAHPSNQSVAAGATATFSVTATGATSYQWQRSTNSGSSWSDISGATSSSYTTPATTVSGGSANNGDQYRCRATNTTGTTDSNAATLSVSAGSSAPVFSVHPSAQSAVVGATATFTATSSGTPTPTYQWQRSTDGGTVWYDIPSATSASYTTPAVALKGGNAAAGDRFRRRDTNSAGSATSNAAALTVTGGSASMSSDPLGRNGGTLNGAETLVWAKVINPTTGEDVTPVLTSISVNSSSVFTLTGLPAGTYPVFYRGSSGRMGWGVGVAA